MKEVDHKLIEAIQKKYNDLGEDPNTYLKGLLQAKPITYWDYIEVDALHNLQHTRTDYKDEKIFIMYHQVTELITGMMMHELKQLVHEDLPEQQWIVKLERLNRYTDMLVTSFDVMRYGMDYDDYNTFRMTLAPASGFQSVSFRYIELYCTPLINLINKKGRERLPVQPSIKDYFDNIYWKDAGLDRSSGKTTLTLRLFQEKYEQKLIKLATSLQGKTLADKFSKMEHPSQELVQKMQEFDQLYNVKWPIIHLESAAFYLDKKGESKAATGGSEWKKYLHPRYQQRKFFPTIWKVDPTADYAGELN